MTVSVLSIPDSSRALRAAEHAPLTRAVRARSSLAPYDDHGRNSLIRLVYRKRRHDNLTWIHPRLGCTTSPGRRVDRGGCTLLERQYRGHTDVKEIALYAQDSLTKGNWTFNYGLRADFYAGLSKAGQAEPRGGIAYNIRKTNSVLRISYARTQESPFNENLVLSSTGCSNTVIAAIMLQVNGFPCTTSPLDPGWRNEFHTGLQQAFGKYFVLSGEYIWKYTHNAYDFKCSVTLPSPSRLNGTTRRFPDLPLGETFRKSTDSRRLLLCPRSRRASFPRQSAE